MVVADNGVELDGSGSSPEPAEQVVTKEIEAAGGDAVACFASVAEEAGAAQIVQTALAAFGHLDVVVNNPGICDHYWFDDLTAENFRRLTESPLSFGTVYVCQAAWPHLQKADHPGYRQHLIGGHSGQRAQGRRVQPLPRAPCSPSHGRLALDGRRLGIRVNAIAHRREHSHVGTADPGVHFRPARRELQERILRQHADRSTSPRPWPSWHTSPVNLTGEVFVSGDCKMMRIAVVESTGLTFTPDTLSPETIAANLDTLMDTTDSKVMGIDMFN